MPEKDLFIRFARSMRDGVCRCTLDEGRILFANRGFVDIFGLECRPEALTGKLLGEVCVGFGAGELLAGGRGVHRRACRFGTLMGEDRRVILDSFVTDSSAAHARVATLIIRDVTDRARMGEDALVRETSARRRLEGMVRTRTLCLREANERLLAGEAKYRELVEHANSIIMKMDRAGRVTFFNEYAERFFGFNGKEILGKSVVGTIVPDVESSRRDLARLLARIARGTDVTAVNENVTRDGRRVWVAWTTRGIRDSRGALVGVLAIGNDVTERTHMEGRTARLNRLKERLLASMGLGDKLGLITDGAVKVLEADFARIWMTAPGDLCEKGCIHASVRRGPHVCRDRSLCLHLVASSGRYPRVDGSHRRVPMGCYKIGRVASGADSGFITNEVVRDPRVHDHEWARSLGLVSFAGYRLLSDRGRPIGVFALFSTRAIVREEEALLEDLAHTASQVILAGRAENALRRSETHYRSTIDTLAEAIHVVDADLRLLLANKACTRWARKFGLRGVMLGRTVFEVFPFLPEAVGDEYRRVFLTGKTLMTEERIVQRGRELITETRKIPVIEGGKTAHVITVIADITARRNAEEAIRESEEKYRTLFEQAPDSILVLDAETSRFIAFNARAHRTLGYTRAEFCALTVADIEAAESAGEVAQHIRKIIRRGSDTFETKQRTKQGRVLDVLVSSRAIVIGGKTYLQEVWRDITDRKRMEDTIRASEEKYRALIEGAGDAIFLANREGMLVGMNRRGQKLLGYSRKALVGMHFTRLHPPGDRARVADAFLNIAARGEYEAHDIPLLRADGKVIPADITGCVIRYGGTMLMQGIMRDISERKRIEAMKDTLIRDVSHELKAPIAMMEMAHAMAEEALAARDLEGIRRAKEISARNLAVLGRDVANIVGMCALRGRTMAPKPARVSLAEIAGEIAGEMRDRIEDRKIALTVRIAWGADRITADRRMMRTLLYNLMDNAVKFTRRGRIALVAARSRGWVTISVRDTGQGLAPGATEEAFAIFHKGNPAMQGTGLGLPICREIAALHGGTIRLESRGRGKGTTVRVRLPLRRAAPRRAGRGGAG